jgi:hypothetical protein
MIIYRNFIIMCTNNRIKSTYLLKYRVELFILKIEKSNNICKLCQNFEEIYIIPSYSVHVDIDIHLDEKLLSCY